MTDPYPSAQSLFNQGRANGDEDTFNNVFKKDLIEIARIKGCRKMRQMRANPYPDALLRRGLHKKELRETADPMLEEAMMYSAVVGVEMMEGIMIVHDVVDKLILEASERKVEVDGALVQLCHQLWRRDDRIAIIDEWKGEVTEHIRDIREVQGWCEGGCRRLSTVSLSFRRWQWLNVGRSI